MREGKTVFIARVVALALAAFAFASLAFAQAFPSRPVRIVVPFPPGGAADLTTRVLADHLAKVAANTKEQFGQPWGLVAMFNASGRTAPARFLVSSPALQASGRQALKATKGGS